MPLRPKSPPTSVEPGSLRPERTPRDPRLFQIAMLASLLGYGIVALGFPVDLREIGVLLFAGVGAQLLCTTLEGRTRFDPRSAIITSLSLALLLRASELWILAAAAAFAMASKFVLRARGKHLFNPSALALAVAIALTGEAWLSPGQWGSAAWFAFAIAGLGGLVVFRAERSDVTWAFAAFWCALLFGRALYIGEPASLPLHRLQDGALLLFTFFMISDPKTTPDSRAGRIVFAGCVAALAFTLKFGLHVHAGLVHALVACAPLVPWIDRWLPGPRYAWPGHPAEPTLQGVSDEKTSPSPGPVAGQDGPVSRPGWARI